GLQPRVDARQPEDTLRPPVRRNLFGRPDPGEIRRNVAAAVRDDVQAFRERYNFDPVEHRPLAPRNYEWQEDSSPPEFYLRAAHGSRRPDAAERSERRPDAQPAPGRPEKRRSGASGDSLLGRSADEERRRPRGPGDG
uniref:Cyclin-dependent kinase inhibitor 1B n=1 Tax=Scophthalmus maximus TaxID=52904 RepID=A0A8D3B7F4_SCOMX